ncbi:MAG TPA: matrixin family metalloprotease, partial [Lacipirellulaceae bacterium]|nr:matrixin family metalloprotease [Lacipirellulaceae bacterium]
GPGGYTYSTYVTGTNSFTQSDSDYIAATTASFTTAITTRGQESKFSRWGGAITFDNDGSSTWYFDKTGTPSGNVIDFYSVALHELAHAIGFGTSSDWQSLVSGTQFVGDTAITNHGGTAVPLSADLGHWANGTTSVIYGTSTPQETLMDPSLTNGTRKRLTELDAAALEDIGWSLAPAPVNFGDYNDNGFVDTADYILWGKYLGQSVSLPNRGAAGTISLADYNVWRMNFGKTGFGSGSLLTGGAVPEPATGFLAMVYGLIVWSVQRRRFR